MSFLARFYQLNGSTVDPPKIFFIDNQIDANPVLGTRNPCKSLIYRDFLLLWAGYVPLFSAFFRSFWLTVGTQIGTQKFRKETVTRKAALPILRTSLKRTFSLPSTWRKIFANDSENTYLINLMGALPPITLSELNRWFKYNFGYEFGKLLDKLNILRNRKIDPLRFLHKRMRAAEKWMDEKNGRKQGALIHTSISYKINRSAINLNLQRRQTWTTGIPGAVGRGVCSG